MGRSVSSFHRVRSIPTARTLAQLAGITIPESVKFARISVEDHSIRYREDGVNPTTNVGHFVVMDSSITFDAGTLRRVRIIEAFEDAVVCITFYKS